MRRRRKNGVVIAILSLADLASLHEPDETCPCCGRPLVSPTIPEGYDEPHRADCAKEIERRTWIGGGS